MVIANKPPFQVFLVVRKAYDSLDIGRSIEILRGYRMGQNTVRLIDNHWDILLFVPNAIRFLGVMLVTGILVTQVNSAFPVIFNSVVDVVVRAVLEVVCAPQEAQHGMGWVAGERNLVFYVDAGWISGRYHIQVQYALTQDE